VGNTVRGRTLLSIFPLADVVVVFTGRTTFD
jgi:hypothetical protein